MVKSISEILKEVSDRRKTVDRVEILQKNDSDVLRGVLFMAFNPAARTWWALPEGAPPYKPSILLDNHAALLVEWRKLGYFLKPECGGAAGLTKVKRETLFAQMLETIHADDALLMVNIKDGIMPYPGVTEKIVKMAFPGLLPEPVGA
jgi:hypothetical protein